MKLAHNVKVSVFCKEEDCNVIKDALMALIPLNLEQERVAVQETKMKGERMGETDITIIEVILTKERHINKFLEFLNEQLTEEQKAMLIKQSESRFDEDLNFFLRLGKNKYMEGRKFWLTDSGDCFHIRISIAAYPKRYDTALAALKHIFRHNLL